MSVTNTFHVAEESLMELGGLWTPGGSLKSLRLAGAESVTVGL